MDLYTWLPLLIYIVLGGAVAVALFSLSLIGRRRPNATKQLPFESGILTVQPARQRFSIDFYLTAMLFIVFDIETVFMIPWAAYYQQLSCAMPLVGGICPPGSLTFFGLGEMLVFVAILVAGYLYIWKKGALQWD